jgi:hypothetical protein
MLGAVRRERGCSILGKYEDTCCIVGIVVDGLSACVDARWGPCRRCRVPCPCALSRELKAYREMAASNWSGAARFPGTPLCGRLGGAAGPSVAWDRVPYRCGQSISRFTAQRKQGRVRLDGNNRSDLYPVDLSPGWEFCLLVAGAAYIAMAVKTL